MFNYGIFLIELTIAEDDLSFNDGEIMWIGKLVF